MNLKKELNELAELIEKIPASTEQTNATYKLLEIKRHYGFDVQSLTGNVFQDLAIMHDKFKFHDEPFTKVGLRQRIDFIDEELNELKESFDLGNSYDIVDALEDIIVVAVGTLDLLKVNGEEAWFEVMGQNMKKELGFNPKRPNSEGKDLIKPEGWTAPNHSKNVGILPQILNEYYDFKYSSKEKVNDVKMIVEFTERKYSPNETSTRLSEEKRRYALDFLDKCKEFMLQKAADYNSDLSSVKSADYYKYGGAEILFFNLWEKVLRIRSVLDIIKNGGQVNFDTLDDSFRDLAIFSALFAEWKAGKMDGQNSKADIFNQEKN